jgi:hypothetical protein
VEAAGVSADLAGVAASGAAVVVLSVLSVLSVLAGAALPPPLKSVAYQPEPLS